MRYLLLLLTTFVCTLSSYTQQVFGFLYYTNESDSVMVTEVFKGSPAEKAGLKAGDLLNFMNDIPLPFKKKDVLTKILSDAPVSNNELRFYRKPDVKKTTINKAPLNSFEFSCISGNCSNGECMIESIYGYTIKGKCAGNTISGTAECFNKDGSLLYKGKLLNNKFDGDGIQYLANKSRFEGTFKNGF
ncbi:MAG TPA: PDZ domain-containing protein, partial [Chitinophagales bacterium]|nr:PDZ domain-containing protein [Chitinophagales bacterium]